jgi:1-aminocyclopropane-1-carboxylate deaminase/D-cysteine desulfhydrase-like pyridoxal-dependent ACC family enzyme
MEGRVITAKMIAGFREHRILEERSVATIQKYIRDVKAFMAYAQNSAITKETVIAYKKYLQENYVRFMDTNSYDDIYEEMDRVGKALGKTYYKIPCGGSNAIGALGYVNCMKEIADTGMHFDYVCCAEGSGGTHAGVALGAMLYMPQTKTVGLMVDSDPFEVITTNIMQETAKLLELDFTPTAENVHLIDMCGPGYAIPSPEGNAAIRMMAENEGLFLDPVYTGKAFAGLVKMAREGQFKPTDNVLYPYSGGAGGLFAIDVDLG